MDNQPELNKIKLPMPRIDNAFPYSNLLEYFEAEATRQHIEKVKAIKAELENASFISYEEGRGVGMIEMSDLREVFNKYIGGKVND